jgi:proline iminopeptidase
MMPSMYQPGKLKDGKITAPAQESISPYWKMADGIEIYHFSEGHGVPVLVLHGGPGFPYAKPWPGLEPLADKYQFQYFHQRGCGKSGTPIYELDSPDYFENMKTLESKLGLGALLSDIEQIRQILGVEKLILIGHSYGGFLATLYAAEFPEHVDRMILIAPANVVKLPSDAPGLYEVVMLNLPDSMITNFKAYMQRYFDYGNIFSENEETLRAMNKEFFIYYAAACSNMGFPMTPITMERTGGWACHAPNFSTGEKYDFTEFVKTVTAPTLIIHGDKDINPIEGSKLYHSLLTNSTLEVIPGADHFPYECNPAEFAKLAGDFLK